MAAPTYNARVLVLRKTKLGEADLVLTLLARDGSQVRAVAKGARKPRSPFASRLELYAVADVMLAKGRSLDIVKEARLVEGNEGLRFSVEKSSAAAVAAELLERATQTGLENARLFDLAVAYCARLCAADTRHAPALAAACLLKACAFLGVRPHFDACVLCGGACVPRADGTVAVSCAEGGLVCEACRARSDALFLPEPVVAWARFFLASTFVQVEEGNAAVREACAVLGFLRLWVREHVGANLKSLDFLLACAGPLMEE